MKFQIHIDERKDKGLVSIIMDGKEYGCVYHRELWDMVGTYKRRNAAVNAVKARVYVELLKKEKGIPNGLDTDQQFGLMNYQNYWQDWQTLRNKVEFELK